MKLAIWFLSSVFSNVAAFLAAAYFVPGFIISYDLKDLAINGLIFALLNLLLKPILKFFLTPLIILTFGLGLIAVNAFVLYLLTFLTDTIIIQGTISLLYATLIIGAVNFLIHLLAKLLFKKT